MIVLHASIGAAYGFAAMRALPAIASRSCDVTREHRREAVEASQRHRSVASVLAAHRRVLLTLGLGVMIISAARATRQSIVPLWAESQGVDAATTSVIFGISAGVDLLLFYPGGAIGPVQARLRRRTELARLGAACGFAAHPQAATIGLVAAVMGPASLSAGVVMTLGADASPRTDRAQFFGGWRLALILRAGGPL